MNGENQAPEQNAVTFLTVDQILATEDRVFENVPIPEWGGFVRIQSMMKDEQNDLREQAMVGGKVDQAQLENLMFAQGVVEPKMGVHQVVQLRKKLAGPFDRILKRIMVISGLDEDAVKQAERKFRQG